MPKKVAISHAHRLCEGAAASVTLVLIVALRVLPRLDFLQHLRIQNRRADAVASACPFAQVDQSATIAAERKLLVRTKYDCSAGWTTQTEILFSSHTLQDARYQIIVVRFSNFTAIELAGSKGLAISKVVDEDFAVDFRCMHRRSPFP
jgi:hypothetical protein